MAKMDGTERTKMSEFFDKLASTWASPEGEGAIREKLVGMMGIPEGAVIADIGSGRGVMFPHLLKLNPSLLISVELSFEMSRLAREEHTDPRIQFINCDILDAELPEINAAVIFNAYPHLLDKKALSQKLASHTIPGGLLAICHSKGRGVINEGHSGGMMADLSVPLRAPEEEACEFSGDFTLDSCCDTDEIYFLKLIRK